MIRVSPQNTFNGASKIFISIKTFSGCFLLGCLSSCRHLLLNLWLLLKMSCKVLSCLLYEHKFWLAIKPLKPEAMAVCNGHQCKNHIKTISWWYQMELLLTTLYKAYLFLNQLISQQWLRSGHLKLNRKKKAHFVRAMTYSF